MNHWNLNITAMKKLILAFAMLAFLLSASFGQTKPTIEWVSIPAGTFTIGKAVDRLERLTRCREIESRISELRGQLKKAAFNRQVELNTQIKKFEQELKQLAASL